MRLTSMQRGSQCWYVSYLVTHLPLKAEVLKDNYIVAYRLCPKHGWIDMVALLYNPCVTLLEGLTREIWFLTALRFGCSDYLASRVYCCSSCLASRVYYCLNPLDVQGLLPHYLLDILCFCCCRFYFCWVITICYLSRVCCYFIWSYRNVFASL